MARIATRVFVVVSILFGVIGVIFFVGIGAGFRRDVLTWVFAAWGISGCVVLSSFALAVAGRYLAPRAEESEQATS